MIFSLFPSRNVLVTGLRCVLIWLAFGAGMQAAELVDFALDVEPILRSRCVECHGANSEYKGGFKLTDSRSAFQRADSGEFPIVPRKLEQSSVWRRVSTNEQDLRMPPDGGPLSDQEQSIIRAWIEQGAAWSSVEAGQKHWAYEIPVATTPPPDDSKWSRNAIDNFILDMLNKRKIQPSAAAEPARLLRRVYLDLIGLPPSVDDVNRFVRNPSDEAYAEVVNKLLSSPRYGEKWARHWLDLARYSDSNGYQADQIREMWAFRDWVIDAMNRDMPYDQFTIEQLAGDLLPNSTVSQQIATGFHRATTCNVEAGVDPEGNRTDQVIDRVNTTATTWLGTTLACAQCHNHKYDPISQQEYYEIFAFFNNTPIEVKQEKTDSVQFNFYGPKLKLPIPSELALRLAELENRRNELSKRIETSKESSTKKRLQKQKKEMDAEHAAFAPPTTLVMQEMPASRETKIFLRGSFLNEGTTVTASVPQVMSSFPQDAPKNRLGFAKWLVDPRNPLTARVAVNRWWHEFFGRGIVSTIEDFGTQGDAPTHPQLLDWLAVDLQTNNWSMKRIHRLIVMSSTYRQSSRITQGKLAADPDNKWLARGPRNRLPAELIRDNALAISGHLVDEMCGPPVYPPQPQGLWHQTGRNEPVYAIEEDADRYRRGVYVVWRRAAPYPSFTNFDAPDRMNCIARRPKTNTPLQALTLLNDEVYVELAKGMAIRVMTETEGRSVHSKVAYAMKLALARAPNRQEVELLSHLFENEYEDLRQSQQRVEDLLVGVEMLGIEPPREKTKWAAWTCVCNAILNLDETITK